VLRGRYRQRARRPSFAVDAYGGPEFRLAEQNFAKFADAPDQDQPAARPANFLMSGGQGGESNNAGLIPTAMLSSMFGQMIAGRAGEAEGGGAEKLRGRTNGQ